MPEAPEVQVVVDTMAVQLKNAEIEQVDVRYDSIVAYPSKDEFIQGLSHQHFRAFKRIGKYLIFEMDDKILISHLRMEGKFYIYDQKIEESKHIHLIFYLKDGRKACYHDTRKFGRFYLYPKTEDISSLPALNNVGYDFTDERCTADYFYTCIHPLKRTLKSALLDQRFVAGIGNIYANEICFACGLDPRSRCNRISKKDCETILFHTRRILNEAIQYGGSTIRDYTSSLGVSGRFQLRLKVHARDGQPCPNCGCIIEKIFVNQRGTYLCRNCQKRK